MANPLRMQNLADIGQRVGRQSISALRLFLSLGAMMATGNLDIEVEVSEGHVSLTGSVADVAEKARAERIARSLFGVRSLSNEIQRIGR
jgi:hypothetical protein